MKILVLGAGKQGGAAAFDLLRSSKIEEIGVADQDAEMLAHGAEHAQSHVGLLFEQGHKSRLLHQQDSRRFQSPGIGRIACVGPAGENLVKYASITSDRRYSTVSAPPTS